MSAMTSFDWRGDSQAREKYDWLGPYTQPLSL